MSGNGARVLRRSELAARDSFIDLDAAGSVGSAADAATAPKSRGIVTLVITSAAGSRARRDTAETRTRLVTDLALALTDTSSRVRLRARLWSVRAPPARAARCRPRPSSPSGTVAARPRRRRLLTLLRHRTDRLRFDVYDGTPRVTMCARAAAALATPPPSRVVRFGRRHGPRHVLIQEAVHRPLARCRVLTSRARSMGDRAI